MNDITNNDIPNIGKPVFTIRESLVGIVAEAHFGYKLNAEEIKLVAPAMEHWELAGQVLHDAIEIALMFIIDPSRCDWKSVDPKYRDQFKHSLMEAKEYFEDIKCDLNQAKNREV
jgi:hypothetical protein